MSSLRPCALRHLTTPLRTPRLPRTQRRHARVHDVRFVATQNTQDRILDRYRTLLEEKAKAEGHNGDIGKLKEAYKDKITTLRKRAAVPGVTAPLPTAQSQPAAQTPPTSSSSSAWPSAPPPPSATSANASPLDAITPSSPRHTAPGVKTLSSFLDVPKTLTLPPREIETIWRLRHAGAPLSLCASIPASTWATMHETARRHPQFVLPGLPAPPTKTEDGSAALESVLGGKEEGVEAARDSAAPIHFLQWTFPSPDTVTVLFTHLAEYKLRGEWAQPHTTVTHHLELAGPKGLVLAQGNVLEGRGTSVEEGRWLIMCLQKFYAAGEKGESGGGVAEDMRERRTRLLRQFTGGDAAFSVDELMSEAERMG